MEPSDIDGPKGGETPIEDYVPTAAGTFLKDLLGENVLDGLYNDHVIVDGVLDLDAIASAFKAAVLAGGV